MRSCTPPADERVMFIGAFYCGIHEWFSFRSAVAAVSIHFWSGKLNLEPYLAANASIEIVIRPAKILPPLPVERYALISTSFLRFTLMVISWLNVNTLLVDSTSVVMGLPSWWRLILQGNLTVSFMEYMLSMNSAWFGLDFICFINIGNKGNII